MTKLERTLKLDEERTGPSTVQSGPANLQPDLQCHLGPRRPPLFSAAGLWSSSSSLPEDAPSCARSSRNPPEGTGYGVASTLSQPFDRHSNKLLEKRVGSRPNFLVGIYRRILTNQRWHLFSLISHEAVPIGSSAGDVDRPRISGEKKLQAPDDVPPNCQLLAGRAVWEEAACWRYLDLVAVRWSIQVPASTSSKGTRPALRCGRIDCVVVEPLREAP